MKKSQTETTTAKNLEEKFDRGEDVLDYFDVRRPRVIKPRPASKPKFAYPAKRTSRSVALREKPAAYRKSSSRKPKEVR
jgi:hypothetical protein